jgi:plasmid stabilization system protein ParE
MSYEVRWKRTARDELANLWVSATDRQAVTDAANAIDAQLQRNPLTCGEGIPGERRILVEMPLVVVFRVREQEKKVIVLSVRGAQGRP